MHFVFSIPSFLFSVKAKERKEKKQNREESLQRGLVEMTACVWIPDLPYVSPSI